MENRKLWIIGDSFTGAAPNSWTFKICEKFIDGHYYVSSRGSRDIQTIFDIFLHKLHKIQPNDIVILFLPTLSRFRLPLSTPYKDLEWSNNIPLDRNSSSNMNSMIGNNPYQWMAEDMSGNIDKSEFTLESPLNYINPKIFKANPPDEEPNFANISYMINNSKASIDNWNRILKSVQMYVPFKLLYYSWTNEYGSECVIGKNEITSNLGYWETINDLWKKTNGEYGKKGDEHWSTKTHESFANYIIKTNAEYFNQ